MSDSEEDFASADEGDVRPSPAGISKVQPQESPPVMEKVVKDQQESKVAEKSQTGETAGKSDRKAEESTKKQNKKKGGGSEKHGAVSSEKESGKGGKKTTGTSESDAQGKGEEKTKQKPQGAKGKKGKQKAGKGKTDRSEKGASLSTGDSDTANNKDTVAKKSDEEKGDDTTKRLVSEPSESKVCEESGKGESENEHVQELTSEKSAIKDAVTQPERNSDLKSSSPEKKQEISSIPQENLTVEQKASMIKSPSSQSITRPEPDHTDRQEAVLDKLAGVANEKKSGWGWGWGSSLLEVASTSVTTFTSQVGEGLHTMMETVESTLNVPDPEELAQKVSKQTEANQEQDADNNDGEPGETDGSHGKKTSESEDQSTKSDEVVKQTDQAESAETQSSGNEEKADNQSGDGWFASWGVSSITKMVESTGKNLVTGSLDVLETLGKKTFDVINEHDPGLKKARAFLHDRGDKPNLSAMLRDAKDQHDTQVQQEKESEEARKAHFGSLFDDFQGLAHLEALEMLSNQSEKRVNVLLNALPAEAIAKLKPQLLEIKQNFEIDEEEDEVTEQEFALLVTDLLKELNVGTTCDKILKTHASIEEKLTECCDRESKSDVKEIHQVAISSLAELTSKCIEQFHKAGELILIQKSTVSNFTGCSNTLLRLTKVLTAEVGILSTKFADCLNKHEGDEIKVSHLVTNIYLEASNSSSYTQDGFQLLLPVLQQAAIEISQEPEA